MSKPVCAIVGVGPGNGAAFARKFANTGYQVALIARSKEVLSTLESELEGSKAYCCDVTAPESVQQIFSHIRNDLGEIETLIYNAGAGVWKNFDQISPDDFEQSWRVNALGSFLVAKEVVPYMQLNKRGNIIFIGATASRRGNVFTAAFAPAKAAQKSLAESLARFLGPQGIHVSLVIIDGVVDTPSTRTMFPDKPDDYFMQPEDVSKVVLSIAEQTRTAWAFEVEIRPFGEKW
jgi:NAD(P)-dependent dehydrogenase (short-subunit alcohol dehydrogenase family)